MPCQVATEKACSSRVRPSNAPRKAATCKAQLGDARSGCAARRGVLAGTIFAAALFTRQPRAWALIPDEEDEDLLEKAKANKAKRLQQQRETTREFIREEGLKNTQLDQELIPVQKAVVQLAKSGSQLEAGDLPGVASTLSASWVAEFEKATKQLSDTDAAKAGAASVLAGIGSVQTAASKGDGRGSKQGFVALVGDLQKWAAEVGVSGDLKGL